LRLLNEVAGTKGNASLRKSQELLEYVSRNRTGDKAARSSSELKTQEQLQPVTGS
jgi:hypothetical protein